MNSRCVAQKPVLTRCFPALILALCVVVGNVAFAQLPPKYELADLKALEQAFVRLAEQVRPEVVAIRTHYVHERADHSGTLLREPINQGSGMIISTDGYIATNRHVLEDANHFTVVLDNGSSYDADLIKADLRSDLAVLKIEATDLPTVCWGDLADVKVNEWTFAVGNPFGLANDNGHMSVTFGTISAIGRSLQERLAVNPDIQYYGYLIEATCAINPGNSGGPLFNIDGEVIGVITAIETNSGVNEGTGFAIPIDKNTRGIIETLQAGKTPRYGFMGVTIEDVRTRRVRRVVDGRVCRGAKITDLSVRNGPAAKAGLKPGDIILTVDDVPVESRDHLIRLVQYYPAGSEVAMTYLRRTVKRKTVVTLGDRYELLGLLDAE